MIMPKNRFRFDNKYLYGSAAFVVGFGGILSLLVHFAPVQVPNANIATVAEKPASQETTTEATPASQSEAQPSSPAPSSSAPVTTRTTPPSSAAPVTPSAPVTVPTTPAAPAEPVTEAPVTTPSEGIDLSDLTDPLEDLLTP